MFILVTKQPAVAEPVPTPAECCVEEEPRKQTVVEFLQAQKNYHVEQIKRIEEAIDRAFNLVVEDDPVDDVRKLAAAL